MRNLPRWTLTLLLLFLLHKIYHAWNDIHFHHSRKRQNNGELQRRNQVSKLFSNSKDSTHSVLSSSPYPSPPSVTTSTSKNRNINYYGSSSGNSFQNEIIKLRKLLEMKQEEDPSMLWTSSFGKKALEDLSIQAIRKNIHAPEVVLPLEQLILQMKDTQQQAPTELTLRGLWIVLPQHDMFRRTRVISYWLECSSIYPNQLGPPLAQYMEQLVDQHFQEQDALNHDQFEQLWQLYQYWMKSEDTALLKPPTYQQMLQIVANSANLSWRVLQCQVYRDWEDRLQRKDKMNTTPQLIKPILNDVECERALTAACAVGQVDDILWLVSKFSTNKRESVETSVGVIDLISKGNGTLQTTAGRDSRVNQLVEELIRRDAQSSSEERYFQRIEVYNKVLQMRAALVDHPGNGDKAERLLKEMIAIGIPPTVESIYHVVTSHLNDGSTKNELERLGNITRIVQRSILLLPKSSDSSNYNKKSDNFQEKKVLSQDDDLQCNKEDVIMVDSTDHLGQQWRTFEEVLSYASKQCHKAWTLPTTMGDSRHSSTPPFSSLEYIQDSSEKVLKIFLIHHRNGTSLQEKPGPVHLGHILSILQDRPQACLDWYRLFQGIHDQGHVSKGPSVQNLIQLLQLIASSGQKGYGTAAEDLMKKKKKRMMKTKKQNDRKKAKKAAQQVMLSNSTKEVPVVNEDGRSRGGGGGGATSATTIGQLYMHTIQCHHVDGTLESTERALSLLLEWSVQVVKATSTTGKTSATTLKNKDKAVYRYEILEQWRLFNLLLRTYVYGENEQHTQSIEQDRQSAATVGSSAKTNRQIRKLFERLFQIFLIHHRDYHGRGRPIFPPNEEPNHSHLCVMMYLCQNSPQRFLEWYSLMKSMHEKGILLLGSQTEEEDGDQMAGGNLFTADPDLSLQLLRLLAQRKDHPDTSMSTTSLSSGCKRKHESQVYNAICGRFGEAILDETISLMAGSRNRTATTTCTSIRTFSSSSLLQDPEEMYLMFEYVLKCYCSDGRADSTKQALGMLRKMESFYEKHFENFPLNMTALKPYVESHLQ